MTGLRRRTSGAVSSRDGLLQKCPAFTRKCSQMEAA